MKYSNIIEIVTIRVVETEPRLGAKANSPVEHIEHTVSSQSGDVVRCECFNLLVADKHKELREQRNSLQILRKGPQNLNDHSFGMVRNNVRR